MNSGSEVLIVDYSFVEFIDSTGLGILISILKKMGSRTRLILCNLQANVSSTFKLTRMDRVFEIYPTLEDAKSSVSNS
jgi:anti-sigma B factor antagonist